jgi:hypothetical protein
MAHNRVQPGTKDANFFPAYDAGKYYMEKMAKTTNRNRQKELLINATWTAIPLTDSRFVNNDMTRDDLYGFLPQDDTTRNIRIRLRVVGQYCVGVHDYAVPDSLALNDNKPMYTINTRYATHYVQDHETSVSALDLIRVVPNPYYGNSAYELSQLDNWVKITNLPKTCTISIYALNGNLIRRFTKDTERTFIDWDLKNQYGIPIASGAYIIYVEAPGIGHKIVKFFGAIRPQDLNSL